MLNRIVFVGSAILILIGLGIGGWSYLYYRAAQNRIEEFTNTTTKQFQKKGWTFTFQPYPYVWGGLMSLIKEPIVGKFPFGGYEIKGNSQNQPWTIDGLNVDPSQQRGYYRSTVEKWALNSSYTRLVLPINIKLASGFYFWMQVPPSFSTSIKSILLQPRGSNHEGYLDDLQSIDDRQLLLNYMGRLFDQSTSIMRTSSEINRLGERENKQQYVTLVGDQFPASTVSNAIKSSFQTIANPEMGGYGILITPDKIIVTTLNEIAEPHQIQTMIDIGLAMKVEIESKSVN
jgi:hypothetical protein